MEDVEAGEAKSKPQAADREPVTVALLPNMGARSEIERLTADAAAHLDELTKLRTELRERSIAQQQQAAILSQTAAAAAAYKAELDDLKSGAGWLVVVLARQFERQFPYLGRLLRGILRLLWRAARFLRSRMRRFRTSPATAVPPMVAPPMMAQPMMAPPALTVAAPDTADNGQAQPSHLDPARETVLLIVHDASRTGAPILAYNIAKRLGQYRNVVAVLLGGGELIDDFRTCCAAVVGPVAEADLHPGQIHLLVDRLQHSYAISYAIANTIASRCMLRPLTMAQIPVVALIHEFAGYMLLRDEMAPALEWATLSVFSSALTAAAARAAYKSGPSVPVHILRQGRPDLPPREGKAIEEERDLIRLAMRPVPSEDEFLVLGVGTLNIRKGVDFFLATAAAVAALRPRRKVRFVWIGSPRQEVMDLVYANFIEEQAARSGIERMVTFVGDVADLDPAYELADVFFMCSRLDPLPNVAIEAGLRGLPVLCFKDASGIAEVLAEDPIAGTTVVPHLDAHAAALKIAALADDRDSYAEVGEATRQVSQRAFNMDAYVRQVDDLGHRAMALIEQRRNDYETISNDPSFDTDHGAGPYSGVSTRDEAIRLFLARSKVHGIGLKTNFYYRRPCPGFHPQIYEYENAASYDREMVNPLAHFIRGGKPEGPWRHEVITPAEVGGSGDVALRTVLHAHFYYPDLIAGLLRKLARNRLRCDLLLSTGSDEGAAVLAAATKDYDRGTVKIRTVVNRGRDIGPLLTMFAPEIRGNYDIVGHFHGKRSLFLADRSIGETWREFLWQNLIGNQYPMADIILARFAADDRLGLVFPDDPHLSGWDENLEIATELARRMGLDEQLPPFFDFPIGTMFWARAAALQPLFDLKLTWEDYPPEPAPIDGTLLHAIERLLPFAARQAGYSFATTFVRGVTW
jgi:glycosyltransferase involved in cell wall biosynthesis